MFKGSHSLTTFRKFNLDTSGMLCFVETDDSANFAKRLSKLVDIRRRCSNGKVGKNELLGISCRRYLVRSRIDPKADDTVQDYPLHSRMVEDLQNYSQEEESRGIDI